VHGLAYTLDRLQKMMDLYEWQRWPGFFPVEYRVLAELERQTVIDEPDLLLLASPVKHLLPTIGLRVEFRAEGTSAVYSCDTEPSEQVVRLAQGADVLIHEATGESIGHTSPAQAGRIAAQAGVKILYLIHYTPASKGMPPEHLVAQAKTEFSGEVRLAEDYLRIEF
jgi:ribonuclease Z